MMMIMRPLLSTRQSLQSWGRPTGVPSGGDHPLLRKCALRGQHPERHLNQNHRRHPIHSGMNGKNMRNPGRDQSIKICTILHLPQLWSWSNQSLRNAILINPWYLIHLLCGVWTSLLWVPRVPIARWPTGFNRARAILTIFRRRIQP